MRNRSGFLTPDTGQYFNHLIVTILSLHPFQTERTFDQLSLVVQQPFTTDNDLAIIATVKLRYGNIERVLGASQRLGGNHPAGQLRKCKNWDHAIAIKEKAKTAKSAVVIGSGYIGAEIAEQFSVTGVKTTLVTIEVAIARSVSENGVNSTCHIR